MCSVNISEALVDWEKARVIIWALAILEKVHPESYAAIVLDPRALFAQGTCWQVLRSSLAESTSHARELVLGYPED